MEHLHQPVWSCKFVFHSIILIFVIGFNTYINQYFSFFMPTIFLYHGLSLSIYDAQYYSFCFFSSTCFIISFSFSIQNDGSMTPSMYMAPMTWSQTKFKQINLQIIDKSWEDLPNEIFCVRDQKTIIILIFVLLRK